MNRMKNKIFLVGAIFLLSIGIATAAIVPIEKSETLGPYNQGHRYYVHVYNVDDIGKAYVNGKLVVNKTFLQDSGWVEVTDDMGPGKNVIEFTTENVIVGWTYGFAIRQDDSNTIFQDECGTAGFAGCMQADQTKGLVYQNTITIVGAGVHTPKH